MYKCTFIQISSECSTKPLSKVLTSILTALKEGLHKYCDMVYSTSGVNQMWILKNSKDSLECLKSPTVQNCSSIKTFDFSTLNTTFPHLQLKERLSKLVQKCCHKTKGAIRFTHLVIGYKKSYFIKKRHHSWTKVHGRRNYQNASIFDRQHIRSVWRTSLSTNDRHFNGYKLCPSTC